MQSMSFGMSDLRKSRRWFQKLGSKSALLERAAYDERLLFEYWGHEASLLPVGTHQRLAEDRGDHPDVATQRGFGGVRKVGGHE